MFSVLSDFSFCFIFPVFLQITEYFIQFFIWATHESSQMFIYSLKNPFHQQYSLPNAPFTLQLGGVRLYSLLSFTQFMTMDRMINQTLPQFLQLLCLWRRWEVVWCDDGDAGFYCVSAGWEKNQSLRIEVYIQSALFSVSFRFLIVALCTFFRVFSCTQQEKQGQDVCTLSCLKPEVQSISNF